MIDYGLSESIGWVGRMPRLGRRPLRRRLIVRVDTVKCERFVTLGRTVSQHIVSWGGTTQDRLAQ